MRGLAVLLLLAAGCASVSRAAAPPGRFTGLSAVVLERRDRGPVGSMVDGIIFFPPQPFQYERRLNGDHVVALGQGSALAAPLDQAGAREYADLIGRERLIPRWSGEGIRVYCPGDRPWFVFSHRDGRGRQVLEIRDRLQPYDAAPSLKDLPFGE